MKLAYPTFKLKNQNQIVVKQNAAAQGMTALSIIFHLLGITREVQFTLMSQIDGGWGGVLINEGGGVGKIHKI